MGLITTLFKSKDVKEMEEAQHNANKMDIAQKYFNSILKKEKRLDFKYSHFNEENRSIIYKSIFNGGIVSIELGVNMSSVDVNYLLNDICKEIEFMIHRFKEYEKPTSHFVSYELDITGTRKVVFNVGGEEREITYSDDMTVMANAIRAIISEKRRVIEGTLLGRNKNFLIDDDYDLVAFLLSNKGKKVRVEIVDQ